MREAIRQICSSQLVGGEGWGKSSVCSGASFSAFDLFGLLVNIVFFKAFSPFMYQILMHFYTFANICSEDPVCEGGGNVPSRFPTNTWKLAAKREFGLSVLITLTERSVDRDAQSDFFLFSFFLFFCQQVHPFSSTLSFLMIPIHHRDVYPLIKRWYCQR